MIDLFLKCFQLFQNTNRKLFSWIYFAEAGNSRLQGCSVREEEAVLQRFFGVFEILEHLYPSEHFQKSICKGSFSPVVSCRL